MQQPQRKVVCLVETGWEGIRKLTITLAGQGVFSLCIIKGKLEEEVLKMITKNARICLRPIRRKIFKLYIFMLFLKNSFLQNSVCIVMDSKKNYPWVSNFNRIFGLDTLLLEEKDGTYELFSNGTKQEVGFILKLAKEKR